MCIEKRVFYVRGLGLHPDVIEGPACLYALGDGRDFIGLLARLHLPQQQAVLARPDAHAVWQWRPQPTLPETSMQAIGNDTVITQSDDTVLVEGSH